MQLDECSRNSDLVLEDDILGERAVPSWVEITKEKVPFRVLFDMQEDLKGFFHGATHIPWNMMRTVRYAQNKWFTSDKSGKFHLYCGYDNGASRNARKRRVSIMGLVLTYNEKEGSLALSPSDFQDSKKAFPSLSGDLNGRTIAHVDWASERNIFKRQPEPVVAEPCNVKWSNAFRFDPSDKGGKCLHFTAATSGEIFVVFSTIPSQRSSWYYVHIGTSRVSIYKVGNAGNAGIGKNNYRPISL